MLALALGASANVPVIKSDAKVEAQVEQTLQKLTLEEKVGQMMELVTDLFGANDKNGVFYIDGKKTDSILSRYKVGSILNAPNTCAPTAKQWEKYLLQIQKISMKRIGIPCVFGRDFFKLFKGMFQRIMMMGVSPVTVNDLNSGYRHLPLTAKKAISFKRNCFFLNFLLLNYMNTV